MNTYFPFPPLPPIPGCSGPRDVSANEFEYAKLSRKLGRDSNKILGEWLPFDFNFIKIRSGRVRYFGSETKAYKGRNIPFDWASQRGANNKYWYYVVPKSGAWAFTDKNLEHSSTELDFDFLFNKMDIIGGYDFVTLKAHLFELTAEQAYSELAKLVKR